MEFGSTVTLLFAGPGVATAGSPLPDADMARVILAILAFVIVFMLFLFDREIKGI